MLMRKNRIAITLFLAILLIAAISSCQSSLRLASVPVWQAIHAVAIMDSRRMIAPYAIDATRSGGSIVWIIPVVDGVVLVDTGFDEGADSLKKYLGNRKVKAILLTHCHIDHIAAAYRFGDVPIYIGKGDIGYLSGKREFGANFIRLLYWTIGSPHYPEKYIPVSDGMKVDVNGTTFIAYEMPGHTPGSVAWLHRDVLFTGDAAVSFYGYDVRAIYPVVTEDYKVAKRSVHLLHNIQYNVMCDGHFGCVNRSRKPSMKFEL